MFPQHDFPMALNGHHATTPAAVEATVKWFNAGKGFGFVSLADGTGDAFLHATVLRALGRDELPPGTNLKVRIENGHRGALVAEVLDVDDRSAISAPPKPPRSGLLGLRRPDPSTATELTGSVKWFSHDKGFGFVAPEDGGSDIFVHASVLEKSGLKTLIEGEHVCVSVVESQKGRQAVAISTFSAPSAPMRPA